jgi:hypothetical protein
MLRWIFYLFKFSNFDKIKYIMEPNSNIQNITSSTSGFCPVCHQPILPQYYFCPNCGTKLNQAPLSTTTLDQIKLYAFSIVLPMICFLFVTKWSGTKYIKSQDPKTKQIGQIAWALLIISTIFTIYLAYVWTEKAIQSSVNSINSDFGDL